MRSAFLACLPLIAAAGCGSSSPVTTTSASTTSTSTTSSSSTSSTGSGGAPAQCQGVPGAGGSAQGVGFTAAWAAGFATDPTHYGSGPRTLFPEDDGSTLVFGSYYQTLDLGPGLTLSAPEESGYQARLSAAGEIVSLASWPFAETHRDGTGAFWVIAGQADGTSTLTRRDIAGNVLSTPPALPYSLFLGVVEESDGIALTAEVASKPFAYGGAELPLGAGAGLDTAVLKLDAQGHVAWARTLAPALWSSPPAVDHWDRPFAVAGAPGDGVTALVEVYEKGSPTNATLMRLDGSGAITWTSTSLGPRFGNAHPQLTVNAAGDTLISLQLTEVGDQADFGCGALTGPGFLLTLVGADGQPRWSRVYEGFGLDLVAAFDPEGNILLAGEYSLPFDAGGGMLPTPAGDTIRMVLVKLSPDGGYLASKSFGDGTGDPSPQVITVAARKDGSLLLAGSAAGSLDLGLASGPLPDQMARSLFVTRLSP